MANEEAAGPEEGAVGGVNPAMGERVSSEPQDEAAATATQQQKARKQQDEEAIDEARRRRRLLESMDAEALQNEAARLANKLKPNDLAERVRIQHENAHPLLRDSATFFGRNFGTHKRIGSNAWLQDGVIRWTGKMNEKTVRDICELALEVGWGGQELYFIGADRRSTDPQNASKFASILNGWHFRPVDIRWSLMDRFNPFSTPPRLTRAAIQEIEGAAGGAPIFTPRIDQADDAIRGWTKTDKSWNEKWSLRKYKSKMAHGDRLSQLFEDRAAVSNAANIAVPQVKHAAEIRAGQDTIRHEIGYIRKLLNDRQQGIKPVPLEGDAGSVAAPGTSGPSGPAM